MQAKPPAKASNVIQSTMYIEFFNSYEFRKFYYSMSVPAIPIKYTVNCVFVSQNKGILAIAVGNQAPLPRNNDYLGRK